MKIFFRGLAALLVLAGTLLPGSAVPANPGQAKPERSNVTMLGGGVAPLLYQFSGVIENGSATTLNSGTASTSITCSNMSSSEVLVNAIIYGTNALTTYYSIVVTIPAWNTYTFSTHYTALYFDNAIFRTEESHYGTNPIYQGTGRIFSASADLICSAQVLDPTGLPPAFATKLSLYDAKGFLARSVRHTYLPAVLR